MLQRCSYSSMLLLQPCPTVTHATVSILTYLLLLCSNTVPTPLCSAANCHQDLTFFLLPTYFTMWHKCTVHLKIYLGDNFSSKLQYAGLCKRSANSLEIFSLTKPRCNPITHSEHRSEKYNDIFLRTVFSSPIQQSFSFPRIAVLYFGRVYLETQTANFYRNT
jgi:hypothetical protein